MLFVSVSQPHVPEFFHVFVLFFLDFLPHKCPLPSQASGNELKCSDFKTLQEKVAALDLFQKNKKYISP